MKEKHEYRFTGWFIPREVVQLVQDGTLSPVEMLLLCMVDALSERADGCYATNAYLGEQLRLKPDTISKYISHLQDLKLVRVLLAPEGGRKIFSAFTDDRYARMQRALERHEGVGLVSEGGRIGIRGGSDDSPRVVPAMQGLDKTNNKNTRPSSSGSVLEGGFFGKDKTKTFERVAIARLERLIREKRKLQIEPNRTKWLKEMEALVKEVGDKERVKRAIIWLESHYGEEFVPRVYSAADFRKKFYAIDEHIDRVSAKASVQSPANVTREDQLLHKELNSLGWPKASAEQLLVAIHQSRTKYELWRKNLVAWRAAHVARGSDMDRWLTYCIPILLPHHVSFVHNWFKQVHRIVKGWKDWNGDLGRYVWNPGHPEFTKMGHDEIMRYGGSRTSIWVEMLDGVAEQCESNT